MTIVIHLHSHIMIYPKWVCVLYIVQVVSSIFSLTHRFVAAAVLLSTCQTMALDVLFFKKKNSVYNTDLQIYRFIWVMYIYIVSFGEYEFVLRIDTHRKKFSFFAALYYPQRCWEQIILTFVLNISITTVQIYTNTCIYLSTLDLCMCVCVCGKTFCVGGFCWKSEMKWWMNKISYMECIIGVCVYKQCFSNNFPFMVVLVILRAVHISRLNSMSFRSLCEYLGGILQMFYFMVYCMTVFVYSERVVCFWFWYKFRAFR